MKVVRRKENWNTGVWRRIKEIHGISDTSLLKWIDCRTLLFNGVNIYDSYAFNPMLERFEVIQED